MSPINLPAFSRLNSFFAINVAVIFSSEASVKGLRRLRKTIFPGLVANFTAPEEYQVNNFSVRVGNEVLDF